MSDLSHSDFPSNAVTLKDGHPVTTSLAIAEIFGKTHKDVLRAIRNLDCSADFNGRNFAPVDYIDPKGEKRPMYEITRDGMVYLVMGFTGPLAARFKVAYIDAFNALDEEARTLAAIAPEEYQRLWTRLQDANARAQALEGVLLASQPRYAALARYVRMGLSDRECALLLNRGCTTVRTDRHRLQACGILRTAPVPTPGELFAAQAPHA